MVPPMATFCQRGVLGTGMAAALILGEEVVKGEVEWWRQRVRFDGLTWESRLDLTMGGLLRKGVRNRREGWAKEDARTREVIAICKCSIEKR